MKSIGATLLGYLTGAPGRYARLFSLRLADDNWYFFTDFQFPFTISGIPVNATSGIEPITFNSSNAVDVSAIETTDGGIAQNAELRLNYVDGLSRDQVLSGLMDDALFLIDLIDWQHPTAGAVRLMTGTIQRKNINDIHFGQWNIKGQLGLLDGLLGQIYSQECRNILGDARCKVNLATFTETFSVASVLAGHEYTRFTATVTGARAAGFFALGFATFALGAQRFEVLSDAGTGPRSIILAVPRNEMIEFGDTGTLVAGCDKRHTSCLNKFDNIVNMNAEPFRPIGSLQVQT